MPLPADLLVVVGRDRALAGRVGIDLIEGHGGNDLLYGGDGRWSTDVVYGGQGNDLISGGTGPDRLMPGRGSDAVYGEKGVDVIVYNDLATPVDNDLQNGSVSAADGADTLAGIENATGTSFADTIRGDEFYNELKGLAGNDTFISSEGDSVNGGPGSDHADYRTAPDPVSVNLPAGNVVYHGETTFLALIEEVTGTNLADRLIGGNANDLFRGLRGNDVLSGGPGNDVVAGHGDNDVIIGGDGDDALDGGAGSDQLEGNSGSDDIWGGLGGDVADGGTAPGEGLDGDVIRYDGEVGGWVGSLPQRFECEAGACWEIYPSYESGGVTVDLEAGAGHFDVRASWENRGSAVIDETDAITGFEAAYGDDPSDDTFVGGLGALGAVFCGLEGADSFNTQDGFGGDLADALDSEAFTRDPGDGSAVCP